MKVRINRAITSDLNTNACRTWTTSQISESSLSNQTDLPVLPASPPSRTSKSSMSPTTPSQISAASKTTLPCECLTSQTTKFPNSNIYPAWSNWRNYGRRIISYRISTRSSASWKIRRKWRRFTLRVIRCKQGGRPYIGIRCGWRYRILSRSMPVSCSHFFLLGDG